MVRSKAGAWCLNQEQADKLDAANRWLLDRYDDIMRQGREDYIRRDTEHVES